MSSSSENDNWEDSVSNYQRKQIHKLKRTPRRNLSYKLRSAKLMQQLQTENRNLERRINTMNIEIKDVITAIPVFSGDKKELETFINTCDLYVELVPADDQTTLLRIIKTKITGEALAKISPTTALTTWPLIKAKLKEKIVKKVSIEFAREDLGNTIQTKDDTIEKYANKIRKKLKILNEASKELSVTDEENAILRKINEKHAICKFEQNIRDNTLRILVSAAAKETLDDCVMFAIQKELLIKTQNNNKCANCGLIGHEANNCRRRKNDDHTNRGGKYKQNNNPPSSYRSSSYNNNRNNGGRSYGQGTSTSNENVRNGNNNSYNNNYNNKSKNNIKSLRNNDDEEVTLRDLLIDDEENESYQINNIQATRHDDNEKYCKIKFALQNNEIIIEIPTSISDEKIKFCIDTGAQISVIIPQKILNAKIDIKN